MVFNCIAFKILPHILIRRRKHLTRLWPSLSWLRKYGHHSHNKHFYSTPEGLTLQVRGRLLLCLKLLTTVCNSRYSGMVVLGESAQPWGRILWRCRAEQWLFRLLHSSRRRHICKGRGKNPSFKTFLSYEIDLISTTLLFLVILACLQNICWGSKIWLCWSFEYVRNNFHCLIRIIIRMTLTNNLLTLQIFIWFLSLPSKDVKTKKVIAAVGILSVSEGGNGKKTVVNSCEGGSGLRAEVLWCPSLLHQPPCTGTVITSASPG